MESQTAFILTATYRKREEGTPEVRLFGKTESGAAVILLTHDFEPYFFVKRSDGSLVHRLEADSRVERVEDAYLTYNQVRERCLKVVTRVPSDVADIRDKLKSSGYTVFAADISYPLRFMYDKDLGPYVDFEGDLLNTEENGTEWYYLSDIRPSKKRFDPKLTYLSLDIENSMKREDKMIFCKGWATYDPWTKQINEGCLVGTEEEIIAAGEQLIYDVDPDIITGYNINQYDLPHIKRRANSLNITFNIGRGRGPIWPKYSKDSQDSEEKPSDGDIERWSCDGRIVADAWKLARARFRPKRETLAYVAEELGVGIKMDVDTSKIDEEWKKSRKKVMKYCARDARLALEILLKTEMMLDAQALAEVAMLPMEMCVLPRQSWLVDSRFIRAFDKAGAAVPCMNWDKVKKKKEKIKGALVVEPTGGVYEWLLVLDYKAMYPSIIMGYNLCYTTYVEDDTYGDTFKSPAGALFLKNDRGIVPKVIEELQSERDATKALHAETGKSVYKRVEGAIKILSNAVYGLFTSSFYRFTNKHIGETITALARENITRTIETLASMELSVLYGDTDSVFVQGPEGLGNCKSLGDRLVSELSTGSMKLELEKILKKWFTHGKKKRYIGLVAWPNEGEYYTRGYTSRRGDTFDYQGKVEDDLLREILTGDPAKACEKASKRVVSLLMGEVETERLIITRTVKKEAEYVHPERLPGVRAARKLTEWGYRWIPGTKLSWIVTDGSKTPIVVEPWIEGRHRPTPDLTYYARRIVETIKDITAVFGYDKNGLYSGTKPTSLFDFGG